MQIVKNDPRQLSQADAGRIVRAASHLIIMGRTDNRHVEMLQFLLTNIPEARWAMSAPAYEDGRAVTSVMAVFVPRDCEGYAELIGHAGKRRHERGEEELVLLKCNPSEPEPDPATRALYYTALNYFEHAVSCPGAHHTHN